MSTTWRGAVAVITGAGSGIGRALATTLARRGAIVHVTDVDAAAATATADAINASLSKAGGATEGGGSAEAARLDVRDAAAVKALVDDVAKRHNRIDYIFNNAGIGVGGELQDMVHAHWERIIAINLWGVIHGVHAAYPHMIAQGSGHIVNVASLAGLVPSPLLVPYATTKHAVVGLSTSLRVEAAPLGVKVSCLCPAAIETPLLDQDNPGDLKPIWHPDTRRFLTRMAGPPYPVEAFAEAALDAVARNEGIIVLPARARVAWRLGRIIPSLIDAVAGPAVAAERKAKR